MLYRAQEQCTQPVVMTASERLLERKLRNWADKFESDFADFERNRMYPPNYRKENVMVKLSMEHVNAICHAEFFYNAAISKLDGSRMRKSAEDDLLRLAELKLCIVSQLTTDPGLFMKEQAPDGDLLEKDAKTDGDKDKS